MRSMRQRRHGDNWMVIFLVILAISIAFGFAFDFICDRVEKKQFPKTEAYREAVVLASQEFGVPENLIWAVIKVESDFNSSAESDAGEIGLMQISWEVFDQITNKKLMDGFDPGMRYDPATNIRYGAYYLSYLYARYGSWNTAIAAYDAGEAQIDAWLADPEYGNAETGVLTKIPDKVTRRYQADVNNALERYGKIY